MVGLLLAKGEMGGDSGAFGGREIGFWLTGGAIVREVDIVWKVSYTASGGDIRLMMSRGLVDSPAIAGTAEVMKVMLSDTREWQSTEQQWAGEPLSSSR